LFYLSILFLTFFFSTMFQMHLRPSPHIDLFSPNSKIETRSEM
jgi:hypothetical protein